MHYRNGRKAKNGDRVLVTPHYGHPYVGVLVDSQPGSTSCNGTVQPIDPHRLASVTVGECLHLDDVAAAAKSAPDTSVPTADSSSDDPSLPVSAGG